MKDGLKVLRKQLRLRAPFLLAYLTIVAAALAFTSCATLYTECGSGLGIGYGHNSKYLDAVVVGSPADKAGVIPGGYIQPESKNFPPKGLGDVVLVVRYPTQILTFTIQQGDYCGEILYQGREGGTW